MIVLLSYSYLCLIHGMTSECLFRKQKLFETIINLSNAGTCYTTTSGTTSENPYRIPTKPTFRHHHNRFILHLGGFLVLLALYSIEQYCITTMNESFLSSILATDDSALFDSIELLLENSECNAQACRGKDFVPGEWDVVSLV
jgi:hypothetical protein